MGWQSYYPPTGQMAQYYAALAAIVDYGKPKHPTRAETGATANATRGVANVHFSHDLASGFPLVTLRRLNWRALVGELRSFLLGHDNHRDFYANGCGFWKPWARPDGSLGPVYGVQWNRHGQLAHVLRCLRERPTDRRMVVSAWRPDEHGEMVLPPCHLMWCVTPYDNALSLAWFQRSCDFPIGVPYNIGSYALLTHLLAAWAGMAVGSIDAIFCDAHVYENQVAGVRAMLDRTTANHPTPRVSVSFRDPDDFTSWDATLHDYAPDERPVDLGAVEV